MRSRPGFALLMVLGGLLVLGLLGTLVATEGRTETALVHAVAARARADAVAEGGVHMALVMIRHPDPAVRWPVDGSPRSFPLGGAVVTVRVSDEAGRVDLNAASPALLEALFGGVTGDRRSAVRLAGRVAATEFAAPAELRRLPGIDTALYEVLADHVTVFNGKGGLDPDVADPRLVALLTGGGIAADIPLAFRAPSAHRVYRIIADVRTPDDAGVRRTAVVDLMAAGGRPFRMLSWQ